MRSLPTPSPCSNWRKPTWNNENTQQPKKKKKILKKNFLRLKKEQIGGLILFDIKNYYKVTEPKQCGAGIKIRHINQWNTLESLEANPHTYGQMMFKKSAKTIQWGKGQSTNGAGKINTQCKRIKLDSHLIIPYRKINSKWIKYQNVRAKNIKLFRRKHRGKAS